MAHRRCCSRRSVGGAARGIFNPSASRFAQRSCYRSKSEAKTEMKRAEIFMRVRVGIDSVVKTDRTDRQFIAQSRADSVAHIVEAGFFRGGQQIARIGENRSLQFAEERKRVFNIENRIKFAPERMTPVVMRPEIPLTKTSHGVASSV